MTRCWHRWLALVGLVVLLAFGCSSSSGPKIVHVSGTVRYLDKPVPGVVVHFVPEEGRASTGLTDEQGRYKLSFDRRQEGAEVGMDKVYFKFRPRNPKEEMEYAEGRLALPPEATAVLEKYGDPETTPLRYEVKSEGQVIDITLD
jgi:hypothetical protein